MDVDAETIRAFAQVHVRGSFSLVELEPPPYEPPEHRACREYADGELRAVMDAWFRLESDD